jgi:hypothetical protein
MRLKLAEMKSWKIMFKCQWDGTGVQQAFFVGLTRTGARSSGNAVGVPGWTSLIRGVLLMSRKKLGNWEFAFVIRS